MLNLLLLFKLFKHYYLRITIKQNSNILKQTFKKKSILHTDFFSPVLSQPHLLLILKHIIIYSNVTIELNVILNKI